MEQAVERELCFGRFSLNFERRALFEAGRPVRLGSRALDLLFVLAERAGELVTKDDLIASAWPDTFVDEGNLRVHIAALRKVLGEDQSGSGYVTTVAGRGYRFTAALRPVSAPQPAEPAATGPATLPPQTSQRVFGRDEVVSIIAMQLPQRRFISVVGIGGIGKTTVALKAAEQLSETYADGMHFLDIAALADASLLRTSLAVGLGRPGLSELPPAALIEYLADKRMLLILDSCEHMIEPAASFAEAITVACPGVHLLATSREPLRAQGERVIRLGPLDYPMTPHAISAYEAMTYPAVQLFVERANAHDEGFRLTDTIAPAVATICKTLDGIALAIELAAGRAEAFGVVGLAERLDDRFSILTNGRRTALPRQQTLQAAFEWSYDGLPGREKIILARLGVFSGLFTLEAAMQVVAPTGDMAEDCPDGSFVEGLANLVSKSLVAADISVGDARYRLLDTTRSFAVARLRDMGELELRQRLHATCFLQSLRNRPSMAPAAFEEMGHYMDNVRSALSWAFSASGDPTFGALLTAAAAPLFLDMSLLSESARWTEASVAVLATVEIAPADELAIWANHAIALIFSRGNDPGVQTALARALAIAEATEDATEHFRILEISFLYNLRTGEVAEADRIAAAARALSERKPVPEIDIRWLFALSAYYRGDHRTVCAEADNALLSLPRHLDPHSLKIGVSLRLNTMATMARSLWWLGSLDQATQVAEGCIGEARALGHPVTTCAVLAYLAPIWLWRGDIDIAEPLIDELLAVSAREALHPAHLVGTALKGAVLSKRGNPQEGYQMLRTSLACLRDIHYLAQDIPLSCHVIEALVAMNQLDAAFELTERMLADSLRYGEAVHLSIIHRFKGDIIAASGGPPEEAERHLRRAIDIAREQHAAILELSATISLGRLQVRRGDIAGALYEGRAILERIREGRDTAYVAAARQLVERWSTLEKFGPIL